VSNKVGMIEIPEMVESRMAAVELKAIVVSVGSEAWADEVSWWQWWKKPRAKPGDTVLVTKYAGIMVRGNDGKQYRLVNDRDIFCGVEA